MTLIDNPNQLDNSDSYREESLQESLNLVNCKLLDDGRVIELSHVESIDPVTYKIVLREEQATIVTSAIALARQVTELWQYVNDDEWGTFIDMDKRKNLFKLKANAWKNIEEYIVLEEYDYESL